MKALAVVTISLMAATSFAYAQNGVDLERTCGTAGRAFWSGTSCENYVRGIVAGMALAGKTPGICFPYNFDPRQTLPIVRQFMANHPEALNNSEARIVQMALHQAYPCN